MEKNMQRQESRVILLGKALTLSGSHFRRETGISKGGRPLISLGYFDSLQIILLEKNDWLQELWEKGIAWSGDASLETYYHPIYITALPCERAEDCFWNIETQFTFVTLLHYAADLTLPKGKPFALVSQRVKELTSPPGQWKKDGVRRDVYAACYRSLHLSDMVVIWKSDSLMDLLKNLHELYRDSRIGDLRTACSFHFPQGEEASHFGEDVIPYVRMSFCVRDSAAVGGFTKRIREPCPWWPEQGGYFTTGIRDLEVVKEELAVKDFLKCVGLWSQAGEVNDWYQKAFYESSTHLGVWDEQGDAEQLPSPEGKNPLTETCKKLFDEFQLLRKQMQENGGAVGLSWIRAVSSQLSVLVDMSQICVLDGFCYLILDGAQTFLHMVRPYLEENRRIPSCLLERIQRFVRGWGTLLDQAVRVDGQFVPSPGFSPVLYDIPVELLEFYDAFAFRCMTFLQSPEEEAARHRYALFMIPKLCRRTKVQSIFHAPPPSDRLLYVDIPLDILFAPMQVLPQICHELSHYCGEDIRQREFRASAIITACAHMIAWQFHLGNLDTVLLIREDLKRRVKLEQCTYMYQLRRALLEFFTQLFQHYEWIQPWQDSYSRNQGLESGDGTGSIWCRENTLQNRSLLFGRNAAAIDFGKDLREIFYLFEEGYADISMMFLLSLSREEYLSLYQQELRCLEETGRDAEQPNDSGCKDVYTKFVLRATLVLSAIGCPAREQIGLSPRLEEFSRCVADVERALERAAPLPSFIKGHKEMTQDCLPVDLLLDIRDYLQQCWQKMQSTFDGKEELKRLRHVFGEVARKHHIGCEGYYETLACYEKFLQR